MLWSVSAYRICINSEFLLATSSNCAYFDNDVRTDHEAHLTIRNNFSRYSACSASRRLLTISYIGLHIFANDIVAYLRYPLLYVALPPAPAITHAPVPIATVAPTPLPTAPPSVVGAERPNAVPYLTSKVPSVRDTLVNHLTTITSVSHCTISI